MSRPASESLGTAKRTRTLSSCADSVERYAQDLPPLPPSRPTAWCAPSAQHTSRLRKRTRLGPDTLQQNSHTQPLSYANALPFQLQPPPFHASEGQPLQPQPHLQHYDTSVLDDPANSSHENIHEQPLHSHVTNRLAPLQPAASHSAHPPHAFADTKRRRYHPPVPIQPVLYHVPPSPTGLTASHRQLHHDQVHRHSPQRHAAHRLVHPPPQSTQRNYPERPSFSNPPSDVEASSFPAPASSSRPVGPQVSNPLSSAKTLKAVSTKDHEHPIPSKHSPRPVYNLPNQDDSEGHLIYNLGEGLHPNSCYPQGRYKILSDLGEGTFGKVVECWDRKECQRVAIKVVRSVSKYREAARLEIDVLLHLNRHDPDNFYHCVKLYSCFDYHSHVCMVFEKLGPSLYEQLRRNRFRPFPLHQVRDYAFQLLESVNFVHNLTLIHTDLKPENILLVNSKSSNEIKLIDFGSATFQSQHHSAVISTRHYRAPEVILGLGWTYPCDLWSIGCILVELYTGQALFQTHENLEHLAMMSGVLGPIPDSMIRRADGSGQKYFNRGKGGRRALNWPAGASSKASVRSVRGVQSLKELIRSPDGHSNFFDLVRRLLSFEPDTRCTSAEALKHPFFRESAHESDPPLTTPTLSSESSVCGSHGVLGVRKKSSTRKRGTVAKTNSSRGLTHQSLCINRVDDEREDTATEMPLAAEHSDQTIVAAAISARPGVSKLNVS